MENNEVVTNGESNASDAEVFDPIDNLASLLGAVEDAESREVDEPEAVEEDEDLDSPAEEVVKQPVERKHKLKIDGTEEEVNESEVLALAQKARAADKRFEEAASLKKQSDSEKANLLPQLNQLLTHYQAQMAASVQQMTPPDRSLLDTDPAEFVRQKVAYDDKVQAYYQAQTHQQQVQAVMKQEQDALRVKTYNEQSAKALEMFPEWKDKAVAKSAAQLIETFLVERSGFSKEDVNNLEDARFLAVAYKAAKYDELQRTNPALAKKSVKEGGVTVQPGVSSGLSQTASAQRRALKQAHMKNPTIDSLAKLLR